MPLFRKTFDFRNDALPQYQNRFSHLDRVVQPGKATAREPEMNGGTTVVFMPYPAFDVEDYKTKGIVLPDRIDGEENNYNPWLFYAEGVRKFGRTPITLLLDNPDDAGFVRTEHHPVHMIWEAVRRTVKSGIVVDTPFGSSESDKWAVLLDGDEPPGQRPVYPVITRPDVLYLAYACIYRSGTNEFYTANNPQPLGSALGELPIVFVMPRSTIQAFLKEANERIPNTPEGSIESLKHPVITGAKYVHFYDRKKNDCLAKNNSQIAMAQTTSGFGGARRAPTQLQSQGQVELAGYGVYISDTLRGTPQDPTTLPRAGIISYACNNLRPWHEVLRGHTPIECAQAVATYCGLPKSVLYHAWKSHQGDYYPDELKTAMRAPVSQNFSTPPAAAPAQAPPPQAGPAAPQQSFGAFGGFGTPPMDLTDPGAAPWGGHISDPPLATQSPARAANAGAAAITGGAFAGLGQSQAPEEAIDAAVNAQANERFRQFLAKNNAAGDVARANAAQGPRG